MARTMVQYVCEHCGKVFEQIKGAHIRRFCGARCSNLARECHLHNCILPHDGGTQKSCKHCGKTFITYQRGSYRELVRFCSKSCEARYRLAQIALPHQVEDAVWQEGRLFLTTDELTIYNELLSGKRTTVPDGYWTGDIGRARGLAHLSYGVKVILSIRDKEGILKAANRGTFERLHLMGFLGEGKTVKTSFAMLFTQAFPELDFMPWELRKVPRHYWKKREGAVAAVRWFLEKHGITAANAAALLDRHNGDITTKMQQEGLSGMLREHNLRDLLRLVDNNIPIRLRYNSNGHERRTEHPLQECPICKKPLRSLTKHLRVIHGKTDITLTEMLLSQQYVATSSPKEHGNTSRETLAINSDCITIHQDWWSEGSEYASLAMKDYSSTLMIRPEQTSQSVTGEKSRRTYKDKLRYRIKVPQAIAVILRTNIVSIAHDETDHIAIHLNPDCADAIKQWLHQ
jgi:endogenous inhibitor of DNA gyrase (YacG/DUF329 family)